MRLALRPAGAGARADIEGSVRPGRLRQIFDDAGNPVVAFDQPDIALLDDIAQMLRIARRERLVTRHLLLQVAGNQLADRIEHIAHVIPPRFMSTAFRRPAACAKAIAIWFMASADQARLSNHDGCRTCFDAASSRSVPAFFKVSETMP